MRHRWSESAKQLTRPLLYRLFGSRGQAFTCPICAYHGPFKTKRISRSPDLTRPHSKCPSCAANERHRMMYLVIEELAKRYDLAQMSVLHIAPEACLTTQLRQHFGRYETADLFAPGVDHKEDLQKMSFPDGHYDCVVISRVLTVPPDLEACLNELRRVLPNTGGLAIVAETYTHDRNQEFGRFINERSREIGLDLLDQLGARFDHVEQMRSDRYDETTFQLTNRMRRDGNAHDAYPQAVRHPGLGFRELVAVAHTSPAAPAPPA